MRPIVLALIGLLATVPLHGQGDLQEPVTALMERVGKYVDEYYRRARTIVARETVRLQPLDGSMLPNGLSRLISNELRIDWEPSPSETPIAPRVTRLQVKSVGRLANTLEEPECFDPNEKSEEPLTMFLPERREKFIFTENEKGRKSVVAIDFRLKAPQPANVTWIGECASIDLGDHMRGRVWIDIATGAVVRVDQFLDRPYWFAVPKNLLSHAGPVSQTIDRLDTSVRYEPVRFRDPDEIVLLPKTIRTLAVILGGGVPRLLTLQNYDQYRRFITGGRVVQ